MSGVGRIAALGLLLGCPGPRHVYPDGSGLQGQLEREVIALQQTVRLLEAEAATCQTGRADRIYAELTQVLAGADVEVGSSGPVTWVVLRDDHVFGSDGLSLREEARMTLDMIATALQLHEDYTVVLEAHTADNFPNATTQKKFRSLYDLSYVHAATVMNVFVHDFGLPETRFTVAARGPHAPEVSNDTTAGQARNRRVLVYIYPPGVRR